MAPNTKTVLKDFIEIYRSQPCLWKVKSKEYHDRDQKGAAYKLLIAKLSEIDPDANKEVVVIKINNLISNVRKEKKKYEESLKSGASADDVYHTELWYYDLFNFIDDQGTPRESSSNLDSEGENNCEEDHTHDSLTADQQNQDSTLTESAENNDLQLASSNNSSRPPKPKQRNKDENLTNEVLESVRDHFKRPRLTIAEDRCDIFGKNVAIKLKSLNKKQMLIAEKIINDLLFEAELGNLTPEHAYINMRDVLRQNQQSNVPASQYQRQVYYQSSPNSNSAYTSGSYISSPSPSPPYVTSSYRQQTQNITQPFHTSQLLNDPQANFQSLNSHSQMQTPTIHGNQPVETQVYQLSVTEDSAATFINNFNVDNMD